MINFISNKSDITKKYILYLAAASFISISPVSFSPAQASLVIFTECETTEIHVPGIGWIAGSAITTCESSVTQTADGSQYAQIQNAACGSGPCAAPPADTDEGLTDEQKCRVKQAADSERDRLANEVADAIRALNNATSNPNNYELGSFVLRLNNGQFVRVEPTGGTTATVSLDAMLAVAQSAFPGIDASNIVAIVHSHPRHAGVGFANVSNITQLSDVDYGNTMPSHPGLVLGPTDWVSGRNFLLATGRTSVADVAHYILGPDGVLRQYNYEDGHPAEATSQQQLINDAETDAKGECK